MKGEDRIVIGTSLGIFRDHLKQVTWKVEGVVGPGGLTMFASSLLTDLALGVWPKYLSVGLVPLC